MGYLKSVGTVVIYIGLFLAVITFIPGLPPDGEFSEYSIKYPTDLKNDFKSQNKLEGVEVLFPGELKGPECFDSYNGELYTTVQGGYVVKLEENRIVPIVKFGKKCDGIWQEDKCGRPLGLKFNSKGDLYVVDTYYGIFKVDVNTKQYIMIINSSEPIDGKIPRTPNSLDIAKNGDIFWTDSSTEFPLYDGLYTFFTNPSGRLIRYNAMTQKNEVLIKNLGFANGLKLSDDESFIIVLESLTSRIIKYNLKGPKAGKQEIFAESLPGIPDNVHSDGKGGFLVSLINHVNPQHPAIPQTLIPHPYIRKMIARLFYLMEAPFKLMQDIYPNTCAERLMHSIGSFEAMQALDVVKTSVILRMDAAGNIIDVLKLDEKVHDISSAYIHDKYLWLGSPFNEYVMRIPLKEVLPDVAQNVKRSVNPNVPKKTIEPRVTVTETKHSETSSKSKTMKQTEQKVAAKPVPTTTTPKPVTTTPKPVTTTPKPSSEMPTTKKTVTSDTTTPKPKASTTTKPAKEPAINVKTTSAPATKQTSSQQFTTRVTTTPPPPTLKASTNKNKKDNPKTSSSENNVKTHTPNVKTASSNTVKKPSEKENKQNVRSTQSEKSGPVENMQKPARN